jgi:anti-anti-sigma factor
MDVTVSKTRGDVPVTVIKAEGIFDSTSVEEFMAPAEAAIEHGANNILIDLSEISFMSSIGIRIINALYYRLHPRESQEQDKEIARLVREGSYKAPHLKLLCPSENVVRVLEMAAVDQYIEIFDDRDRALSAFTT